MLHFVRFVDIMKLVGMNVKNTLSVGMANNKVPAANLQDLSHSVTHKRGWQMKMSALELRKSTIRSEGVTQVIVRTNTETYTPSKQIKFDLFLKGNAKKLVGGTAT